MLAKPLVQKLVIAVCLFGYSLSQLYPAPPAQAAPSRPYISVESINQIRREIDSVVYDINGDYLINCIDYAILFYLSAPDSRIVRNINRNTGMNHLFNSVMLKGGQVIYIEPQPTIGNKHLMEDVWGRQYNPTYNIDETYIWGQQIISREEQERQSVARDQQRRIREAAWQSSTVKPVYGVGFATFSVYSSMFGPAIVSLFPEIGLDVGQLQFTAFVDYTIFWPGTRNDDWLETINFGANVAFWFTHDWSIGIGYGTGGEFDEWNIKSFSPFIRASLGMIGLPGNKRNYSFIKVFYDYYLHGDNYRAGILFGPGLLQAS